MHTYDNVFEAITRYLEYWKDFYPDTAEAYPKKKFETLGEPVTIRIYVDTNHAGNLANRRYHSGILMYVNNGLIKFYRRR